jgi:hypothetical protein
VSLSINTPLRFAHERYLGPPSCPKCGIRITAAEASEYVGDGRICHLWLCDDCDYDFRTLVEIAN